MLKPIALWVGCFAVVYGLLVAPWPGGNAAAAAYLSAVLRAGLPRQSGLRAWDLSPGPDRPAGGRRRIEIVNLALMTEAGAGPVRNLDLDLGPLGRRSGALLGALLLTTPLPWPRRARAALAGAVLWHLAILAFVSFCIWNESSELQLVELGPVAKGMADHGQRALTAQMTLGIPVLIWMLILIPERAGLALGRPRQGGNNVGRVP